MRQPSLPCNIRVVRRHGRGCIVKDLAAAKRRSACAPPTAIARPPYVRRFRSPPPPPAMPSERRCSDHPPAPLHVVTAVCRVCFILCPPRKSVIKHGKGSVLQLWRYLSGVATFRLFQSSFDEGMKSPTPQSLPTGPCRHDPHHTPGAPGAPRNLQGPHVPPRLGDDDRPVRLEIKPLDEAPALEVLPSWRGGGRGDQQIKRWAGWVGETPNVSHTALQEQVIRSTRTDL